MKHLKLPVTKTQRANLEVLHAHLLQTPGDSFDMATFASDDGMELSTQELTDRLKKPFTHTCTSVACMAGNGIAAGIKPQRGEGWSQYSGRVFGGQARGWNESTEDRALVWDWLFDADWAQRDNSVDGGCQRLRIALDLGIPEDYRDQRRGDAPLCYTPAAV